MPWCDKSIFLDLGSHLSFARLPRRYPAVVVFAVQCFIGMLLTSVLTEIGLFLRLNLSTAGLLYLLLVIFVSVRFGFWQASCISLCSLGCETYFFAPPAFTFYISDPRNAIAIIVFEVTAVLVSALSAKEKAHAREKDLERRTTEKLYQVTSQAILLDAHGEIEQELAELILEVFAVESVGIYPLRHGSAGLAGGWRAEGSKADQDPDSTMAEFETAGAASRRLVNVRGAMGTLLIKGEMQPLAMDSLASLLALMLEKREAFLHKARAEAAQNVEQLRTTVLDGLAHDFKTPLTIIRAASSGLLEVGGLSDVQAEFVGLIDEQSAWLNDLATRLLRTSRLDQDSMCLQSESVSIPGLVHQAVAELRSDWREHKGGSSTSPVIEVFVSPRLTLIRADHDMLCSTVKELVNNALKYSLSETPIRVRVWENESQLVISVNNRGPLISSADKERIFERFYRGEDHKGSAPGSGIGLSVARRVAEAHGGLISVMSSEIEGTTFNLSLPKKVLDRETTTRRQDENQAVIGR